MTAKSSKKGPKVVSRGLWAPDRARKREERRNKRKERKEKKKSDHKQTDSEILSEQLLGPPAPGATIPKRVGPSGSIAKLWGS